MPAAVTYTNFGGMLVHENRGGVETEYVNDTIGSLVECRSAAGTQVFTATYWPYGEIRTSTGTNPSQFDFVGALGYYRENANRAYVRARVLRKELARWMTVDPLWPSEEDFGYCSRKPAMETDPSGLQHGETIWDKIWYILNPPPLIIPMPPDPPPWRVPPGKKIKVSPAIEELRHWCSVQNFYYPTWRFGNCCGLGLKCGPGMSNGSCVDKACEKHDICVGPEWIEGGKNWLPCARSFCEDLKQCYKKNGCATQLTPSPECQATWESGKFFCAQVGLAFP